MGTKGPFSYKEIILISIVIWLKRLMGVSEYSTQSENDREALDYMLQHGCDDRQGSVFELFRFRANSPHKLTVGPGFKDYNQVYFFLQIKDQNFDSW